METLSINSNEVKQWRSSILIPEASDSRECFEKYSSKSFGSGMFFIPNTGKYNQAVAVLYEKFSPSEMKVGIAKFEELIVPIMLRYNDGNEMIDLGEVLDKMPIQDFHVLLPIYNIQITDDVIRIGGYSVVKYQYIADYFKSIGITMRGKYTQDPYFNYHDSLFISDLVLKNTEAGEKVSKQENSEYTQYPFVFTKLSENLKKEVSGK